MRLSTLLEKVEFDQELQIEDVDIAAVSYDSRKVTQGSLFVALKGTKTDGNLFVAQALAGGAVAMVSETTPPPGFPGQWIQVQDGRKALARIAANFYDNPSKQLRLVGITGTNGKTSTAFLIDSILKTAGIKCGLISTIEYRGPEGTIPAERTTPESLDLQALFARFLKQGCRYVVMEVSSHALALDRVYACQFRSAVFTNLTPDHLDFHRTLDNYFNSKRQLFVGTGSEPPRKAIINMDDPRGRILAGDCVDRCLTYSLRALADFQLIGHTLTPLGMQLQLQAPLGFLTVSSTLMGRPNLSNILAAIASTHDLGLDWDQIQKGVEQCPPVPGRFQWIDCGQDFRVVIDYAHTEDALEKLLLAARDLAPRRVLLLFGCGGDRDRSKRPAMGTVAARLSDFTVITSDNPRSEDPLTIIEGIQQGFGGRSAQYTMEPDRNRAIKQIMKMAEPGDLVILAGKGHETYQVLADRTIHFDDREAANQALKEMGYKR
jgi:UDP-N-acetylmuramoyl-L-alanyl-D-glutamate--2,6-diaminopimelate ligase